MRGKLKKKNSRARVSFSLKIFRSDDQEEFLDEKFRIEDGYMSGSANQSVGC